MSNAFAGKGTLLQRGDTGGATNFVTVAEVRSLTGPQLRSDNIEVTNLSSTAKEYIPGFSDQGSIQAEANFVPSDTTQQGVLADQQARTTRYWQVVWSDSGTMTAGFQGYVEEFSLNTQANDAVRLTFTVRITGAVTFTP